MVKEAAGRRLRRPRRTSKVCAVLDGEGQALFARLSRCWRGGAASPDETLWAFRRFLESRAANAVVVVFDDIQWAESTLLDLIEHVADWSRDAPILLVCMARRELLDVTPGVGRRQAERHDDPARAAPDEECEQLIENLLGRPGSPRCRRRIPTRPRAIRCSSRRCSPC